MKNRQKTPNLYRPSRLNERELCPGSAWMCRNLPEGDTSTPDAKEGTDLHEQVPLDGFFSRPDLSDEQKDAVLLCREYRDGYIPEKVQDEDKGGEGDWTDFDMYHEWSGTMDCGFWTINGTADCVMVTPEAIRVFDWKFGRGYLSERGALLQCSAYLGMVIEKAKPRPTMTCHVVMPRLGRVYVGEYKSLDQIKTRIRQIIQACEEPTAKLYPGPEQCHYCRALPFCPAAREATEQAVSLVPDNPLVPEVLRALEVAELAKPWIERVRGLAFDLIQSGVDIPGWEIKESCGARVVKDANGVFSFLADEVGLTKEEMLECIKVTLSSVVNKYREKATKIKTKKAREEDFFRQCAEFIEQKPPVYSLRRASNREKGGA